MRVFTNTTFQGHYPVGTAAVVTAANAEDAALMLNGYLAGMGLIQEETIMAADMVELTLSKWPQIRVLCDGNY